MRRLLVLESPWDNDLESKLSVGPFFLGLEAMLGIKVVYHRFNGKLDLQHFLKQFRRFSAPNPRHSYCYIATHGTGGRLEPLLQGVNSITIARASRGCTGRGFILGACLIGNRRRATEFLRGSRASFVAGYSTDVAWAESMLNDLLTLA